MGFEVVVWLWEAPWRVPHGWIHFTIKHVIYVRQFSGSPRTERKHIDAQAASWVGWRRGGKENGLEVEADTSKYMVLSQDQNAGRSHHVKIYYSSCERVEQVKYLWTTIPDQNSIQQEIKSRQNQGVFAIIRCRTFVFSLQQQNINLKIHRTIIMLVGIIQVAKVVAHIEGRK